MARRSVSTMICSCDQDVVISNTNHLYSFKVPYSMENTWKGLEENWNVNISDDWGKTCDLNWTGCEHWGNCSGDSWEDTCWEWSDDTKDAQNVDQNRTESSKNEIHHFAIDDISTPKIIPLLTNIIAVQEGGSHTICLDINGNIFSCGDNEEGQLGIGDLNCRCTSTFKRIDIPRICQISSGVFFTICLSEDNELYAFGCIDNLGLGIGDEYEGKVDIQYSGCTSWSLPSKIASLKDVEFVECGGEHVFCKTLNNEIYCWGSNEYGQLDIGNIDHQYTPILCSSLSNEDIVDIKCGLYHTLVLTSNGDVLSCGNNKFGQLGRETEGDRSLSFDKIDDLSNIIRIECGREHSLCIDINGDLYVFGNNEGNRLGLGSKNKIERPTKYQLPNIIDVSSGGYNVFVKTSNNEIFILKTANEHDFTPIRVFEGNEDIWYSNIKSKAKSARK